MKVATEARTVVRLDPEELDVETLFVEELETVTLELSDAGCVVNQSCTCNCETGDYTNCFFSCWWRCAAEEAE